MPTLETGDLDQKAVYWPYDSLDTYARKKVSATYVELDVRWLEGQVEVTDTNGDTITVDALVVVDREIAIGSVMWKGEEADLPDPLTGLTDIKEVVNYKETPDVKGIETRRVCHLMKYGDNLPETV